MSPRALSLCVALSACGPRAGQGDPQTYAEVTTRVACRFGGKVDMLVVLGDGPSMWDERMSIETGLQRIVEAFERPEHDLQYRLAVTTTSIDNPACDAGRAQNGAFVATSCRARAEDFVAPDGGLASGGCTMCEIDDLGLRPTTTHLDPNPTPRPWIERARDGSTFPEGITGPELAACLGPQGFAGCRFSAPLRAIELAIAATEDPSRPEYGFFRPDAIPVVLVITDADDCSYRTEHADIFLAEGSRTFWSDPEAPSATPAVCWNAGVACTGGPDTYEHCRAQDHAADGTPTDGSGVLRSVDESIARLQAIEDAIQASHPQRQLLLSVVAGVDSDGGRVFSDAQGDPGFTSTWGIGPGCASGAGTAIPPVRLYELAQAFETTAPATSSVCADDYERALAPLLSKLAIQNPPSCFGAWALDTEPDTASLEPSCVLTETPSASTTEGEERTIPACDAGPRLPVGVAECWYPRWDAQRLTPSPDDDLHEACIDDGSNLQVGLLSEHGALRDGCLEMTCEIAT